MLLILFMSTGPVFAGDFDSDCLDQNNEGRAFVQEENTDLQESASYEENSEAEVSGSDA